MQCTIMVHFYDKILTMKSKLLFSSDNHVTLFKYIPRLLSLNLKSPDIFHSYKLLNSTQVLLKSQTVHICQTRYNKLSSIIITVYSFFKIHKLNVCLGRRGLLTDFILF